MQICFKCAYPNTIDAVICRQCGVTLEAESGDTQVLVYDTDRLTRRNDPLNITTTATLPDGAVLRLQMGNKEQALIVFPEETTLLGRHDDNSETPPQVDLTPFSAYQLGVSRRHALLRKTTTSTIEVLDLGSTNGTFLNGERLTAHESYLVRDGDDLRLGRLEFKIYFQKDPTLKQAKTDRLSLISEQAKIEVINADKPRPKTGMLDAAHLNAGEAAPDSEQPPQ